MGQTSNPIFNDGFAKTIADVDVILRKKCVPGKSDAKRLVGDLKNAKEFPRARKLLGLVRENCESLPDIADYRRWLRQNHALCTYKDSDNSSELALRQALKILDSAPKEEQLATTTYQETLGLAGAIYKRLWEIEGKLDDLQNAIDYYLRGWAGGVGYNCYTGINAAFVLDLLAAELAGGGEQIAHAKDGLLAQAREIRQKILDYLEKKLPEKPNKDDWWRVVTAAEAAFGLGQYDCAGVWFEKAKAVSEKFKVSDWEWESTFTQMAYLVRLHEKFPALFFPAQVAKGEISIPRKVLVDFIGERKCAFSLLRGKVGLALSGGGYRAALFHIGTLARLAELDLLRHVEVLSCVSGGSIIGAAYYLRLQTVLENCPDENIPQENYIKIVHALIQDLLELTSFNIRNRAFFASLLWLYSPTSLLGEILDKRFLRPITGCKKPVALDDLKIVPMGFSGVFHPRRNNWDRQNKVPMLLLNATTVNTAHNWQFTASWMGEPPASIDKDIDSTERLRRMYLHNEVPATYRKFPLGLAVAASAAVPMLFPAISLEGLYPGRKVRLVDGGVYDNQGLFGLMEQDCTVALISDASGHLAVEPRPPGWLPGMIWRLTDMFMDVTRRDSYRLLVRRQQNNRQRHRMFVHMKRGLQGTTVDWVGGSPPEEYAEVKSVKQPVLPPEIQRHLADLRTDLNTFSQDEAHSLMLAGYCLTKDAIADDLKEFLLPDATRQEWSFFTIAERMNPLNPGYRALAKHLELGRCRFWFTKLLYSRHWSIKWGVGLVLFCLSWNVIIASFR